MSDNQSNQNSTIAAKVWGCFGGSIVGGLGYVVCCGVRLAEREGDFRDWAAANRYGRIHYGDEMNAALFEGALIGILAGYLIGTAVGEAINYYKKRKDNQLLEDKIITQNAHIPHR
ncbi:hypothetical protein GOV09_06010 [Candidatus Woesearchaeota archaeon]|nr:hypothetical protein [Candidatus Woesearchaeota archaeon]